MYRFLGGRALGWSNWWFIPWIINLQQTGNVTVAEWYATKPVIFAERGGWRLLSFDFPITIWNYMMTLISVQQIMRIGPRPLKTAKELNVMRMMINDFSCIWLYQSVGRILACCLFLLFERVFRPNLETPITTVLMIMLIGNFTEDRYRLYNKIRIGNSNIGTMGSRDQGYASTEYCQSWIWSMVAILRVEWFGCMNVDNGKPL